MVTIWINKHPIIIIIIIMDEAAGQDVHTCW